VRADELHDEFKLFCRFAPPEPAPEPEVESLATQPGDGRLTPEPEPAPERAGEPAPEAELEPAPEPEPRSLLDAFEPEDVAEALQAQLGGQPVLGLYQANEVRETPRWPGSLGQLQPFKAAIPQQCTGPLAACGPA
jgi:hypothetical protein